MQSFLLDIDRVAQKPAKGNGLTLASEPPASMMSASPL